MSRKPIVRLVVRGVATVGVVLALLLAGGAPSDFGTRSIVTSIQVGK